jgi:hypothetical protein
VAQQRKSGFQISYVTITYRSVLLAIILVAALVAMVMYFAFPDTANRVVLSGQRSLGKVLAKMGLGSGSSTPEPGPQQAHFTNIDGTVRVKKAGGTWVQANYGLALERNDVIQTSPEGIAKVVFADGTNYTVKPGSLIVIQENFLNASQQTQVAVQVTTGTVDLATTNISQGSKSQVNVAGATMTIASESAAQVMNDPSNDEHAIRVTKGSGEVNRGQENVKMGPNEKVTFTAEVKDPMVKSKEIGPPFLIGPFDNQQVSLNPNDKGVTFYWSEVENVHAYHLKVSRNQFFSSLIFDKTVTMSQIVLKDLAEGTTYFWEVQSVGENGKESAESPRSKFTLVPKGNNGSTTIALEVGEFVQHGHSIEVRGKTEPGARVLVNGQEAVVKGDGTFFHYTNPLPIGENIITVTAQNSRGGFNNVSRPVPIQ